MDTLFFPTTLASQWSISLTHNYGVSIPKAGFKLQFYEIILITVTSKLAFKLTKNVV